MLMNRCGRLGVLAGLVAALSACGGGGSSAGGSAPAAPTAAVAAATTSTSQGLDVSWGASAGVTTYRVQLDASGSGSFTTVSPDLAGTVATWRLPVSAHLLDWANARVRVQACSGESCSVSAPISATGAMLAAIGYVKASNTSGNSHFGGSAVLSGDGKTLVVGASQVTDDAEGIFPGSRAVAGSGADWHGAVYVFVQNTNGEWSQSVYLKAPNIQDATNTAQGGFGAEFGASVAVSADGKLLAVGAPSEGSNAKGIGGDSTNNDLVNAGAVYVYSQDAGGNWTGPVYIKPSNTRDSQEFGHAVSLSRDGKVLAVGSPGEDSPVTGVNNANQSGTGQADTGAAYVFSRAGGTWAQQAYIKASNARANARFGDAIAVSGNGTTLAVGAKGENGSAKGVNGSQSSIGVDSSGAVYVYAVSGGAWSQQAYVKPSNTPAVTDKVDGFEFGTAVALSDDGATLAVGAPYEDSDDPALASNVNTSNLGAVYVYQRNAATWAQKSMLKTPATGTFANVGASVALNADATLLAVGAPGDATLSKGVNGSKDSTGGVDENGGVFVFTLDASGAGVLKSYLKASNTLGSATGLWPGVRPDFGQTVTLSADGKRLAAGAPGEYGNAKGVHPGSDASGSDISQPGAGAVYVY